MPSRDEKLLRATPRRRRRSLRWSPMVLIAGLATATLVLALDSGRERAREPAGTVHTSKVTRLPPRPRAEFRIVDPKPLSRAEGLVAAQAAAADLNTDDLGPLVRAYSVPGKRGAQLLLTGSESNYCLHAIEPAAGDAPGRWSGTCVGGTRGASHIAGDTFVGMVGPDSGTLTYVPPAGRSIRLRPNADGVVAIQGAADGSGVQVGGVTEGITIGQDARHQCSDGTTVDVRTDLVSARWDPCNG